MPRFFARLRDRVFVNPAAVGLPVHAAAAHVNEPPRLRHVPQHIGKSVDINRPHGLAGRAVESDRMGHGVSLG